MVLLVVAVFLFAMVCCRWCWCGCWLLVVVMCYFLVCCRWLSRLSVVVVGVLCLFSARCSFLVVDSCGCLLCASMACDCIRLVLFCVVVGC